MPIAAPREFTMFQRKFSAILPPIVKVTMWFRDLSYTIVKVVNIKARLIASSKNDDREEN